MYPGPNCRGTLYLDDGVTFNYRAGGFVRVPLSCAETADAVTIETGAAAGAYVPWFTRVTYSVHGAKTRPRQVTVAGKPVRDFTYDVAKKLVTVTAPYVPGGQSVTISY